ncbi:MAG TPA: hypothetical protein VJ770_26715 [Stellaceae bacterium]|nr:hypothetical protein [Stellaceae bacterium]
MILTPIPRAALPAALDRFAVQLQDRAASAAFARIRATSADRAAGEEAERHRQLALAFAQRCGMAVHPAGHPCRFNWDGAALDGSTEAYVILHEIAHFVLAPPARRVLADFGLGPGPDTRDRDAARRAATLPFLAREEDEALASLLGILWEAELGQPALASFLDQNWLEGLDRSAAPHFAATLDGLGHRGLVDRRARPVIRARDPGSSARSGTVKADCGRRGDRASATGCGS